MTEGVKRFLQRLGLVKHYDIFSAKGFDLETDIPHLSPADLKETLMVSCEKEIDIILLKAKQFKASPEHHLYEWLRRNSLDHYFVNFVQSELTDLEKVSNLKLPNVELYDELEIVLPGHKKRLERAVVNLRQEIQRRSIAEKPVTQGWWGKPGCLPQAKFDFLCVEGTVFAPHEPDKQVKIDFMVDSGSDISTMQEETLESLNLELVGPIYSCGIHGGNYTNLYRARLQIGQEQLTIEVIASNYDSLGSRIVRHFRHVIDGNRHIWLKGNYRDTSPPILPLKMPAKASQVEGQQQLLSIENKTPEMDPPADKAFRVSTTPLSPPRQPQHSSGNSSTHPPNLLADKDKKPPPHTPPTHSTKEEMLSKDDQPRTHTIDNHTSLQDSKPVFSEATAIGGTFSIDKGGRQSTCVKDLLIGNTKQNPSVTNAEEGLSSLSCDNSKVKNGEIGVEGKRRLDSSSSASSPRPPKMNKLDNQSSEIINGASKESIFPSENSDPSSIPPSHSQFTGASSSSRSVPGDTGDDVDHMDSELLYDFLSSASASSMSSHNYNTSISSNSSQTSDQFKFFNSNSILTAAVKPNQKPILEDDDVIHIDNDDVIHIDNDEDDDDGGGEIDFITNENTLEKESFVDLGSNNFMRGSNTSSVTISAIDLKEFQVNGKRC